MAYSYINYTATGSRSDWTFPFKYLDSEDVFVTVEGEVFSSQLVDPSTVRISPTPAVGSTIKIFRQTVHGVPPVDFTDGSILEEGVLDRLALFCLYTAQEAIDHSTGNTPVVSGGALSAGQILGELQGLITLDTFALSLKNEITLISGAATLEGSVAYRVLQEALARADALSHEAATREAAIEQEASTRQTALESVATQLTTITAGLDGNAAAILSERTARVTAGQSVANRLDVLEAGANGETGGTYLVARVAHVEQVSTDNTNAISSVGNRLDARVNLPTGKTVVGAIAEVADASAAADQANARSIQIVQSAVSDLANGVSGYAQRVASVETQANTTATTLGIVSANQTIKVQARADGKYAVAGIGANATVRDGVAQSEIILMADKVQFVSGAGGLNEAPQALLQVGLVGGANTLILPAARYGDNFFQARMVVDGGITARKIDTRGLDIKDDAGRVIFSSSGGLDYSLLVGGPMDPGNLVRTPSFESGSPGGWSPSLNPAVLDRATVYPVSGVAWSKAIVVHMRDFFESSNKIPVRDSDFIHASADLASRTQYPVRFGIVALRADGVVLAYQAIVGMAAGGGFGQVKGKTSLPAGTVAIVPWLQVDGPGGYNLGTNYAANLYLGKVEKGATVGATFGVDVFGQMTASNITTYIAGAAIGTALIGDAAITNAKIGGAIWSANYVAGVSGWMIHKDGLFESNDGVFRGSLTAARIAVGYNGQATTFFDPVAPAAPIQSSANGLFTYDGYVGQSVVTSSAVWFRASDGSWPLPTRIRSGSVTFQVLTTAVVDDQLSIWWRINSEGWNFLAGVSEPQEGDGTAAVGTTLTINVSPGDHVQFGVAPVNSAYQSASMDRLYLKTCQLVVTARNF